MCGGTSEVRSSLPVLSLHLDLTDFGVEVAVHGWRVLNEVFQSGSVFSPGVG